MKTLPRSLLTTSRSRSVRRHELAARALDPLYGGIGAAEPTCLTRLGREARIVQQRQSFARLADDQTFPAPVAMNVHGITEAGLPA